MSCWRSKSLYQEGPFHPEGAFCVLSGFIKRRRAGQRHEEAQHGKPRAASSAGKPVTMVNFDSDAIERTVTIVPTRVRQLLVPHILNGERAIELPSIAEKKAYIVKQLTEETWESELRIEMPHKHYVNMTPAVAECRSKMYAELHGGKV